MSIEVIKTLGLRSLGILLVLAGAALLVPSLGATEKRLKTREQEAALYAQRAACRAKTSAIGPTALDRAAGSL